MDKILKNITQFAHNLSYEDLPDTVVNAAKIRMLDALACAFAAYDCQEASIGRKLAGHATSIERSGRALGNRENMSAVDAAFINTCMIRQLDFNDAYPGGHPSDMMGAFFAVAPVLKVSGKKLIVAIVIAYEVFIRHMMARNLNRQGFDQGSAIGLATAAGLSYLYGLTEAQTAHAISITLVSNMQLRVTRSGQLSMWKGCATAHAVRNALFAVYLAKEGMTGPGEPFLGRDGLADHLPKPFAWRPLDNAADNFHIEEVNLKYWPVAYQMQAAAWCGIKLAKQLPLENIANIAVEANSFSVFESGSEAEKWRPMTKATADHSLPYVLAWSLKHGEVSEKAFEVESYSDPNMHAFLKKISVSLNEEFDQKYPKESHMRATAVDIHGKSHCVDVLNPIGHWMNPMSSNHVSEKFSRLISHKFGAGEVKRIVGVWECVEDLNDVGSLFDFLVL